MLPFYCNTSPVHSCPNICSNFATILAILLLSDIKSGVILVKVSAATREILSLWLQQATGEALALEIAANVSRHGIVYLDPKGVHAVTDPEHVVIGSS